MKYRLTILLLAISQTAFAQGLLVPPGPPAPTMKTIDQTEPRTAIGILPYVINASGSYYLTANLTAVSGQNGITVAADNVTIDLNGFTLSGADGTGTGIAVSGNHSNLTAFNGGVRNFADGVSWPCCANYRLSRLTVANNSASGVTVGSDSVVENCTLTANGGVGLTAAGANNYVGNTTVVGSASHGIVVGDYGRVVNCTVRNPGGIGIQVKGIAADIVCNGIVNAGQVGVSAGDYSSIRWCYIAGSSSAGASGGVWLTCDSNIVRAGKSHGFLLGDNAVVQNCQADNNGGDGFQIGASASFFANVARNNVGRGALLGDDSNVHDSSFFANKSHGLQAGARCMIVCNGFVNNGAGGTANGLLLTGTGNQVRQNSAHGNGGANFSGTQTSDTGPVGSAASATSPWANLQF